MEIDSLHQVSDKIGQILVDRGDAIQIDENTVTVTRMGKYFIVVLNEDNQDAPLNQVSNQKNDLKAVQAQEEQSAQDSMLAQEQALQDAAAQPLPQIKQDISSAKNLPKWQGLKKT